jgi:hypothetical protein
MKNMKNLNKKQNNDIAQLTHRTAIQVNPVNKYINSDTEKADIYTENRNKTGIYR